MRPADFFTEETTKEEPFGLPAPTKRVFRSDLARGLRRAPLDDASDVEAAVALARLIHDELEAFGTGGGDELSDEDMREALLGLRAAAGRLGITGFSPPFRDFSSFRSYWLQEGASGSWQARRDILDGLFEDLHEKLTDLETRELTASTATPISPRGRTGWSGVDNEIAELRRHFTSARTPQDYRNVGNDCVAVLEALSRTAYDPSRHLRPGESEPPVAQTKQRLDRFVEDELPGAANAQLRKLTRAAIEMAQAVKHQGSPGRREAGVAADTVILLANLLRRIAESPAPLP